MGPDQRVLTCNVPRCAVVCPHEFWLGPAMCILRILGCIKAMPPTVPMCCANAPQKVARVDMTAPLGTAGDGGGDGAAYSPLERCLTRLEALAGILPFFPAEHAAIYRLAASYGALSLARPRGLI